jgi:hypothetical protein
MREYGIDNFKFTIICETSNEEVLYKLEDFFTKEYDTIVDHGHDYNNNYGGLHGLHSEKTKTLL